MKHLILVCAVCALTACGGGSSNEVEATAPVVPAAPEPAPTGNGERSFFSDAEMVRTSGHTGFIFWPTAPATGPTKWVWYAPVLMNASGTPMESQHTYYVEQLRAHGFAVVGADVGESYGSPAGRAGFKAFYDLLQARGFETSGTFLLQSRGGLMGYTFILENPGVAKAVAGIYPLLTYDDYAGPAGFCTAWGFSATDSAACVADFNAVKSASDPLLHATAFNFPILHVHGDADIVTHYSLDVQFGAANPNVTLQTVPGQGHEFYTAEFFHNDSLLQFIYTKGI